MNQTASFECLKCTSAECDTIQGFNQLGFQSFLSLVLCHECIRAIRPEQMSPGTLLTCHVDGKRPVCSPAGVPTDNFAIFHQWTFVAAPANQAHWPDRDLARGSHLWTGERAVSFLREKDLKEGKECEPPRRNGMGRGRGSFPKAEGFQTEPSAERLLATQLLLGCSAPEAVKSGTNSASSSRLKRTTLGVNTENHLFEAELWLSNTFYLFQSWIS